jgi:hypothetical protein
MSVYMFRNITMALGRVFQIMNITVVFDVIAQGWSGRGVLGAPL